MPCITFCILWWGYIWCLIYFFAWSLQFLLQFLYFRILGHYELHHINQKFLTLQSITVTIIIQVLFKLISWAWSEVFASCRAFCDFGTSAQMRLSVFIIEWFVALLTVYFHRIDCAWNEFLRRGRIEVLFTFWTVLILFLPIFDARRTEECFTVGTNNNIVCNIKANIALKLLSEFPIFCLCHIEPFESLL